MSFILRLDYTFSRILRLIIIALAVLLTGVLVYAVILRYVFDASFSSIQEISSLIAVWLYFLAMVAVTREKSHLTGGLLDLLSLNKKQLEVIHLFHSTAGLAVSGFVGFHSLKYFLFVGKIHRVSTNLSWSTTLWVASAVVGFFLICAYLLRDSFKSIWAIKESSNHSVQLFKSSSESI